LPPGLGFKFLAAESGFVKNINFPFNGDAWGRNFLEKSFSLEPSLYNIKLKIGRANRGKKIFYYIIGGFVFACVVYVRTSKSTLSG
jgi:hypothetical protein